MKLAVLSDIHGNWPALAAVAADIDVWRPDRVLVNGDVVSDGPSNPACWDYVTRRRAADGWLILRGNHEEYVAEWRDPSTPRTGPVADLTRVSHWTYEQLGERTGALMCLPEQWKWTAPDGSRLVAMHGTLLGIRAGIYPFTSDEDVRRRITPGAAVFVTAHTHVAHMRLLDGTRVVNTGSTGIPGDGDWHAAYGRLTWTPDEGWQAQIVRVAYDRAAAERDYFTSGFMDGAGPEAELSLVQFRMVSDVRTRWSAVYRDRILRGEISVAESVREWLSRGEFHGFTLADRGPE
ncbi:MAG: metallophosphoesterase family protein [Anaerolineae bacterium]|nr:metallophosphoesterase family protein [Anaerolineae bacterium]RIK23495.1 MAG: metallophosphoesterase [Anaerolineae bacterium]